MARRKTRRTRRLRKKGGASRTSRLPRSPSEEQRMIDEAIQNSMLSCWNQKDV